LHSHIRENAIGNPHAENRGGRRRVCVRPALRCRGVHTVGSCCTGIVACGKFPSAAAAIWIYPTRWDVAWKRLSICEMGDYKPGGRELVKSGGSGRKRVGRLPGVIPGVDADICAGRISSRLSP
jgi:hypothetical protein